MLREKAGLTVQEVAEQLGVTLKTAYNWESGYTFPKPDQVPDLAKLLQLKSARTIFPEN